MATKELKMSRTELPPAVLELNKVDGFDPADYLVELDEDGVKSLYLNVINRLLWYRLKYPLGKVLKKIIQVTESMAVVEARVYMHKDDALENFIANGLGQQFRSDDRKYGQKFLEVAETAALGRALAAAGFGTQFCAPSEGERQVVDAPQREAPHSDDGPDADTPTPPADTAAPRPEVPDETTAERASEPDPTGGTPLPREDAMPSVEAILADMTVEEAMNVTIKAGKRAGMDIGTVARTVPGALEWYINEYKGKDNYVRAAAQCLLIAAGTAQKNAG